MELKGKISQIIPEKTGNSARGPWRKQEYIIEIPGDYPKQVCFMAWGDKIDEFQIEEGQELTVHINLESREYNGRWYTDVKAWRVERPENNEDHTSAPPDLGESPPVLDDDVPF